ncbi:MAG: hypothetical protein AB7P34_11510 [Vicinamibacterales bacterium]
MRLVVFTAVALLTVARPSQAQLVEVTPEVFAKAKSIAEAARAANPASPKAATDKFKTDLDATYGRSTAPSIVSTGGLSIQIVTPLDSLAWAFMDALFKAKDLSTVTSEAGVVTVSVNGATKSAPWVHRIVLYRDDKPVAPSRHDLSLFMDRIYIGPGPFFVVRGAVEFPFAAFAPGAPVRIVVLMRDKGSLGDLPDGTSVEWTYKAGTLK